MEKAKQREKSFLLQLGLLVVDYLLTHLLIVFFIISIAICLFVIQYAHEIYEYLIVEGRTEEFVAYFEEMVSWVTEIHIILTIYLVYPIIWMAFYANTRKRRKLVSVSVALSFCLVFVFISDSRFNNFFDPQFGFFQCLIGSILGPLAYEIIKNRVQIRQKVKSEFFTKIDLIGKRKKYS